MQRVNHCIITDNDSRLSHRLETVQGLIDPKLYILKWLVGWLVYLLYEFSSLMTSQRSTVYMCLPHDSIGQLFLTEKTLK